MTGPQGPTGSTGSTVLKVLLVRQEVLALKVVQEQQTVFKVLLEIQEVLALKVLLVLLGIPGSQGPTGSTGTDVQGRVLDQMALKVPLVRQEILEVQASVRPYWNDVFKVVQEILVVQDH